jgi:hypothetical protein
LCYFDANIKQIIFTWDAGIVFWDAADCFWDAVDFWNTDDTDNTDFYLGCRGFFLEHG